MRKLPFIAILAALLTLPSCIVWAQQLGYTETGTFTGLPTYITGGATSNYNSSAVPLLRGRGLAIEAYFAGTNAATTGNLTLHVQASMDGTNYSTTTIPIVFTANGATGVRSWTNLGPPLLDNMHWVRLSSQTNGSATTNGIFLTNTTWSYHK